MKPVRTQPIPVAHLHQHASKREALGKFLLLFVILAGYIGYCMWKFGAADGGTVAALTWSFFVLCTPVADAGFLVDFPIRLLFRIRMWVSEVVVWGAAIAIAAWGIFIQPDVFERTGLTSLFAQILTNPWPYGLIVAVSGAGTFLSIKFGDELMDVMHHHEREYHHRHHAVFHLLVLGGLVALVFAAYVHLLAGLGVQMVF